MREPGPLGEAFPDPLNDMAKARFGIPGLFPFQRLVIQNILDSAEEGRAAAGEDARDRQIVILPTGAGKSLCFMLPAFFVPGLTLVIFPLLALMADQLRRLDQAGLPAAVLKGGQDRDEREEIWTRLAAGELRFLLSNPETLISPPVRDRLKNLEITHTVVDEAHTVYEWGRTFRPAYGKMARLFQSLKSKIFTAFTATASPEVLEGIREMLFPGRPPHLIMGNPDRENIAYRVVPTLHPDLDIARFLLPVLGDGAPNPEARARPALVFCSSRVSAELSAGELRRRLSGSGNAGGSNDAPGDGFGEGEVFFYHAGLSRPEKDRIEKWFFHSRGGILCTTCAYGMGVDKPDIRTVIHREPPATVEAYLQEAGRAGRDRMPAEAILLKPWYPPAGAPAGATATFPAAAPAAAPAAPPAGASGGDPDSFAAKNEARKRSFSAVISDNSLCRRRGLLELLGNISHQSEYCAGCDVCAGRVQEEPEKLEVIRQCLAYHRRRLDKRQLKFLLAGYGSSQILRDNLHRKKYFARLYPWKPDDVEKILEALQNRGAMGYNKKWGIDTALRKILKKFMASHCHKKI